MSHTYCSDCVQVIFSTKERSNSIPDDLQPKLWAYMAGIARRQGFQAVVIGGVRDHVQVLLLLPPTMPLAKAVQYLKGSSSKWINDENGDHAFAWQEGYAAFSVSASQTSDVIRYIQHQHEHHERKSFDQEFVAFLKKYNIAYDPAHVLG